MKKPYYENQGSRTFLVFEVEESDSVDRMCLGMLTENNIRGLAPTLFTQLDNQRFIKFDVSAKIPAARVLSGTTTRARILGVLRGVVTAFMAAEDYMLPSSSIILDLSYIFINASTSASQLICLPVRGTVFDDAEHDPGAFIRAIIFNTHTDQTENLDYVAKIINFLNGNPRFFGKRFFDHVRPN